MKDVELKQIRKKKLEDLMKRQKEAAHPEPHIVIEVFSSPSCPHCPRALAMIRELALQMPNIKVIEVSTTFISDLFSESQLSKQVHKVRYSPY